MAQMKGGFVLILLNVTILTTNFIISFVSLQVNIYLGHMLIVCGILDMQIPEGNRPTYIFIDFQLFTGIEGFSMLRIK